MISFNSLGNLGRLGNQMFQYASLKGIATNRGFDFCIPPESAFGLNDPNVKKSNVNIHNTFNISYVKTNITNNKIIQERYYNFDKILFNDCEDNMDLYGYFQSEKYFNHIKNEIQKDFTFSESLLEDCSKFIQQIDSNGEIISLHIRRGDYVNLESFHPLPSLEYYSEALKRLPDLPVLIFSDDCEWCMNQELFDSDRFLVSELNSADFDMCLMTMCNYHIIANSSFSWWGAWLSNSKKVIAPSEWFGSSLLHNDTSDLYCSEWEKI